MSDDSSEAGEEVPQAPSKRDTIVQAMMEKYGLKGKKGKVLVDSIVDRVGENPAMVETMLMRALLPKRIHHSEE
ncbi:MAG TPA: hypothetical protein VKK79_13440 [Candidatus Lokiarchaeia archaeon]|nr:hypothetical protein [Candidatus Lokiarchaeia archaeon]